MVPAPKYRVHPVNKAETPIAPKTKRAKLKKQTALRGGGGGDVCTTVSPLDPKPQTLNPKSKPLSLNPKPYKA